MYATVRHYLHVPADLLAELELRGTDMTAILQGAPGLMSYELVRTREGMFAVTVCCDEESAIEANRRAAAWLHTRFPGFGIEAPEVWSGPVTVRVEGGADAPNWTKCPAKQGAKQ